MLDCVLVRWPFGSRIKYLGKFNDLRRLLAVTFVSPWKL
jgi:hypothetical protein